MSDAPADPPPQPTEPTPEQKQLAEIIKLNKTVLAHEAVHREKAEAAKAAKANLELAQRQLNALIDGLSKPYPLFDGPKGEAETKEAGGNESWKAEPLQSLATYGLSDAVIRYLTEGDLGTVGALALFTSAGKRLTDIKGIGESKAEAIEKSLELFWADRNAHALESADAQGPENASDAPADGFEARAAEAFEAEPDSEAAEEAKPKRARKPPKDAVAE